MERAALCAGSISHGRASVLKEQPLNELQAEARRGYGCVRLDSALRCCVRAKEDFES